jgi:glycosyltransferase involved in cell wall biosynthesis
MKILFLHRFKDDSNGEREFGGAERQLVDLARRLRALGHDVVLLTFYSGGEMLGEADRGGVRIVSLHKAGRWDMLPFLTRLVRALREERADVVHGYLGLANALLVLTWPFHRRPVVWGVRASDIDLSNYSRIQRFDAWIERRLSRFPRLIIANSNAGRDYAISQGFPADRFTVIHNGIDLERFRFDADGRKRLRAEWRIADDEVLIGRAGRLAPQKDFPTFLACCGLLAKANPTLRFVAVGPDRPGPRDPLWQEAERLGISDRLVWAGPQGDMAAVYSAFDISVSSSAYGEGTPNVLAESMACGVPCVTTDAGDSALTVGELGKVVPPRDPRALAEAVLATVANPPDPAALREHIATNFSMDALVTRTNDALTGLLKGERRR